MLGVVITLGIAVLFGTRARHDFKSKGHSTWPFATIATCGFAVLGAYIDASSRIWTATGTIAADAATLSGHFAIYMVVAVYCMFAVYFRNPFIFTFRMRR